MVERNMVAAFSPHPSALQSISRYWLFRRPVSSVRGRVRQTYRSILEESCKVESITTSSIKNGEVDKEQ
jgi:hypothetical protein